MMPLLFANLEEDNIIKKVGGTAQMKHHLENLGIVSGSSIRIVNKSNGNIIVDVKNTRVALSKELAKKILI